MNRSQSNEDIVTIQSQMQEMEVFQVRASALESPFLHMTSSDTKISEHGIDVTFTQL